MPTPLSLGDHYWYVVPKNNSGAVTGCALNARKFTTINPPANDNCAGALTLTVNPDYGCGTVTDGSTVGATQSSETAPDINTVGLNDDVWFKFTATATTHRISLTNITGSVSDMAMAIYSGNCGALVLKQSSDPEAMTVNNLTVGMEYKIRVWTWSASATDNASFKICIGTPPPPPANDECSNATALAVNTDYGCGITTSGYTYSATQSNETAPTANPSGTDDDVWYKFTATSTSHRISFSNVTGSSTDMVIALYSGNCGSLVQVNSVDLYLSTDITGLTPGMEYKIRVWTYGTSGNATYSICIGSPSPPPANDEASGAVLLTVGAGCTGNPYDNSFSTQSATESFPSCKGTAGYGGMWYKFVAPASGIVKISCDGGGTFGDSRLALFSAGNVNDYSTFQILGCDDDNGVATSNRSLFYAAGLTAGQTYYVEVDLYSSSSTKGTYCVTVDELSSIMLANTAADCSVDQASISSYNAGYHGWISLVDANGNLNANVRQVTGTATGFSSSRTIKTGTARTDAAGHAYLNRNFLISGSGAISTDVQLFFTDAELANLGAPLSGLNVTKVAGSTCNANFVDGSGATMMLPQTANGSANGVNYIQVNTPGFSNFYIMNGTTPLPVTFEYFKGRKMDGVNRLDWKINNNESGITTMVLERSEEGRNFTAIQEQKIDSRGKNVFSYDDRSMKAGANIYRIHLTNENGKESYSQTVTLMNAVVGFEVVNIIPNPVKNISTLQLIAGQSSRATIIVSDIVGKVLSKKEVNVQEGSNDIEMDFSHLNAGTYQIIVTNSSGISKTLRFVKN